MKTFKLLADVAIATLSACATSSESIHRNAQVAALNLTPDEARIWETLTPAQQDRAILFIKNGGTLIASLGDK